MLAFHVHVFGFQVPSDTIWASSATMCVWGSDGAGGDNLRLAAGHGLCYGLRTF